MPITVAGLGFYRRLSVCLSVYPCDISKTDTRHVPDVDVCSVVRCGSVNQNPVLFIVNPVCRFYSQVGCIMSRLIYQTLFCHVKRTFCVYTEVAC